MAFPTRKSVQKSPGSLGRDHRPTQDQHCITGLRQRRHVPAFPIGFPSSIPLLHDPVNERRVQYVPKRSVIGQQRKHWKASQDSFSTRRCLFPTNESTPVVSEVESPYSLRRTPEMRAALHSQRPPERNRSSALDCQVAEFLFRTPPRDQPLPSARGALTQRDHPGTIGRHRSYPGAQTYREGGGGILPFGDPPRRINPLRTDVLRREGIPEHKLAAKARVCNMLAG